MQLMADYMMRNSKRTTAKEQIQLNGRMHDVKQQKEEYSAMAGYMTWKSKYQQTAELQGKKSYSAMAGVRRGETGISRSLSYKIKRSTAQ